MTLFSSLDEVEASGLALADASDCPVDGGESATIECLRAISPGVLLATEGSLAGDHGITFRGPAYGTTVLPRDPAEALRLGAFHRLPILAGHTHDEWRFSTASQM